MKKTVDLSQEEIMDITYVLYQRVAQLRSFGTTHKHYIESLEEMNSDEADIQEAKEAYQDCVDNLKRYVELLHRFRNL